MANRAYLYSLSNRPASYADRPETISGLSEWPYAVPFSYRVLLSGDPRLCSSLISDGFEDDPPEARTPLHAISGEFDAGYARLTKLCEVVRTATTSAGLLAQLDATKEFLDGHRDRFLLLETIELDTMDEEDADGLRAAVEREIEACREAGAAVDALPVDDPAAAADALTKLGLRLDDDFDNRRNGLPLGLSGWSDILYFSLWNKAEFAANA